MEEEKYLMRTEGGEAAWKSYDLSLDERRFLSLVKTPLSMDQAKKMAAADPAYAGVLRKGWVKWDALPIKNESLESPLDRLRQKSKSSVIESIENFVDETMDTKKPNPLPTKKELDHQAMLKEIVLPPAPLSSREEFLKNKEVRRLSMENKKNTPTSSRMSPQPSPPQASLPPSGSQAEKELPPEKNDWGFSPTNLPPAKPMQSPKPSQAEIDESFQKFLKHFGQIK